MNRAHVDLTPSPVAIGVGLRAGRYVAQVRRDGDPGTVLYASASEAPADLEDWYSAGPGEFFAFSVSAACPTWARTADEHTLSGAKAAHSSLAIADVLP